MLHQCLLLAEVSQELGVPDAQLFSCVDRCDHLGVPARIYDRILASDKELLYLPLLRELSTLLFFRDSSVNNDINPSHMQAI